MSSMQEEGRNCIDRAEYLDTEVIMDSLYGIVRLSPFEKRLISTVEVQRLRSIKQLGFVSLVFPSAEHSRFTHSIGVCHQSKVLVDQINRNIHSNPQYQRWRRMYIRDNDAFMSWDSGISETERIVISAAGLLHDLSHIAFSHEAEGLTGDSFGMLHHDDYENNPLLFRYLFDVGSSSLAGVIRAYNHSFWKLLVADERWCTSIKDNKGIDTNGYVHIGKGASSILGSDEDRLVGNRLPLLGVMIFEVLLFSRESDWLKDSTYNSQQRFELNSLDVAFDAATRLRWNPIAGWFRPYRSDIVSNVISADVLDYLLRDCMHTGLPNRIDLKFLEHMTIMKARETSDTITDLLALPDFCERVVFDIFDHRRGRLRYSVIRDLLAVLDQKQVLTERVYRHRTVESARAMLQETCRILLEDGNLDLGKNEGADRLDGIQIGDESFIHWTLTLSSAMSDGIAKAQDLAEMLKERRLFGPLAEVIDCGGNSEKEDVIKERRDGIVDILTDEVSRNDVQRLLTHELIAYMRLHGQSDFPGERGEIVFAIGLRQFVPLRELEEILMIQPALDQPYDNVWVSPMSKLVGDGSLAQYVESLRKAHNSQWRVFLFIHPFYQQRRFVELSGILSRRFILWMSQLLNLSVKNVITNYDALLPETPRDIRTFVNLLSGRVDEWMDIEQ